MLTQKEAEYLRKELDTARNPLFLHDADGDGLGAYLVLYRINKEGKHIALTKTSCVGVQFLRKVEEINPDKIFVLDVPLMEQEFADKVNRPIFWIDHHPPQDIKKVKYYNPRIKDPEAYIPTTMMAYQISQKPEDMWLAVAGCLADHYKPDFLNEFIKLHPGWLDKEEDLPTMLFKRQIGKLAKLLFFIQKGPSSEVRKSVKILTKISSPDEIFKEETPAGKFIHKRFQKIDEMFEELLKTAKKSVSRSKLILFFYTEQQWSFTANLANELFGLNPTKYVIIARKKDGWVKCSLRGDNVLIYLKEALQGIDGSGGGHPVSCGAVINEKDWDRFITNFKLAIK